MAVTCTIKEAAMIYKASQQYGPVSNGHTTAKRLTATTVRFERVVNGDMVSKVVTLSNTQSLTSD